MNKPKKLRAEASFGYSSFVIPFVTRASSFYRGIALLAEMFSVS
jgi:hypothetical protein